jgi:hypothetical protein
MILKVVRQRQSDEEIRTSLITEVYSGDDYKEIDGSASIGNNEGIIMTSYDQLNEITNKLDHYELLEAYLMNDNGKTIEKIK